MHIGHIIITLVCYRHVLSANILHLAGIASHSHHFWNVALAKTLAERGHNVTYYSIDADQRQLNFHPVVIQGVYNNMDINYHKLELNPIIYIPFVGNWFTTVCENILKSLFQHHADLLSLPSNFFDILFIDITFPCFYPLIKHFGFPPVVGVTPFQLPPYVAYNFAGQLNPSTVPWYNLPHSTEMTIWQKFQNWFFTYLDVLHYNYITKYKIQRQWAHYNIECDINALERHITLVLANIDPILSYPQPLPPNIIPVGGLQVYYNHAIIDEALKKLLDNAKNGFIVLSLGTIIQGHAIGSRNQTQQLLDEFSKVPETVIWKVELLGTSLRIPSNVVIRKFLPQANLLAHPNVKLFIGHGGALSTHETIFYGVPMICVPFLSDQIGNCHLIQSRNLGVQIDKTEILEQLVATIKFILNDPKQKHRVSMQAMSQRYRDQGSALERAVFWSEYVIKHKNVSFLEPPQRHLNFYNTIEFYIVLVLTSVLGVFIMIIMQIKFKLKPTKLRVQ